MWLVSSSEVCPCLGGRRSVLGHELCDFTDEVRLLCAAFTRLAPLLQDLLEVLHLELLQVHRAQVHLLVCTVGRERQEHVMRGRLYLHTASVASRGLKITETIVMAHIQITRTKL